MLDSAGEYVGNLALFQSERFGFADGAALPVSAICDQFVVGCRLHVQQITIFRSEFGEKSFAILTLRGCREIRSYPQYPPGRYQQLIPV